VNSILHQVKNSYSKNAYIIQQVDGLVWKLNFGSTKIVALKMEEQFKVYVERLRHGKMEEFDFSIAPDFLEIKEEELVFKDPVSVNGEAYLAENELVINVHVKTNFWMNCQICNEPTQNEIEADVYNVLPPEEFTTGIYDMAPLIREELLLMLPQFVECHDGQCPSRKDFAPFLKKEEEEEDEGYQPFKDLK
jgi:uncharacterized metal-binding protein YceD (DUF177 family)